MRTLTILMFLTIFINNVRAQFKVDYDPNIQPQENLQYFTPKGDHLFVGDCIPYFHKGTLYLYWLLDQGHHSSLNGLGGHQWTLSSTRDLKHWNHFPIVIGIDEDWEKSICTGSVEYDGEKFYAFYATRLIDSEGKVNEQLSYATSSDAIHFNKQNPNPFYTSAPGYSKRDFRDPKVIIDNKGIFHLLVSSSADKDYSIASNRGCLVHLSSADLKTWQVNEPILSGQRAVPECPDYFYWKGWYYLFYSQDGNTSYLMSQKPYGPWIEPAFQAFNEDLSNVVKTAEFTNDRRIAASWIPSRKDNKDIGYEIFGGSILLREIIQLSDGTLGCRFPEEMIPETGKAINLNLIADQKAGKIMDNQYMINAPGAIGSLHSANIPVNCRITLEVSPQGSNEEIGLYLRSADKASAGYKLSFSASNQQVSLENSFIKAVTGLDNPFKVDIVIKGDIIDVCINGQRCIVNRLPEQKGNFMWLYAKHGKVVFKDIKVMPIIDQQTIN